MGSRPYQRYFSSESTFRDTELADDRLPAKEPIFAFHVDGAAWAVPHRAVEGGGLFELPHDDRQVLLFREKRAPVYASTEAWLVTPEAAGEEPSPGRLLAAARGRAPGVQRLEGFDTFWYTWVGVNWSSRLLR